jgi:hypothetical protein
LGTLSPPINLPPLPVGLALDASTAAAGEFVESVYLSTQEHTIVTPLERQECFASGSACAYPCLFALRALHGKDTQRGMCLRDKIEFIIFFLEKCVVKLVTGSCTSAYCSARVQAYSSACSFVAIFDGANFWNDQRNY